MTALLGWACCEADVNLDPLSLNSVSQTCCSPVPTQPSWRWQCCFRPPQLVVTGQASFPNSMAQAFPPRPFSPLAFFLPFFFPPFFCLHPSQTGRITKFLEECNIRCIFTGGASGGNVVTPCPGQVISGVCHHPGETERSGAISSQAVCAARSLPPAASTHSCPERCTLGHFVPILVAF